MLEGTEKDHLDWGNFCLFWLISNEEIHSTEHMLLTEFYFLYPSLGCIIGQNWREAVGEEKHKPSSYFMVLCFSLWTRTRHTRFSRKAGQPWGPRPRGPHCCAEVPGARDMEWNRIPTVAGTSRTISHETETWSVKTNILRCAKNML